MPPDDPQAKPVGARPPQKRTTAVLGVPPQIDARTLGAMAERFGVPAVDVAQTSFPLGNLDLIPLEIARRHVVVPIMVREDAICLAMADPSDRRVIEELEFVSGRRVFPYAATAEQLKWAIEACYPAKEQGVAQYQGPRWVADAIPTTTQGPQRSLTPPPNTIGATMTRASEEIALDEDDLEDPDLRAPSINPGQLPNARGPSLDSVFSPIDKVQGRTILVVDDEEDIRRLLRRVLEEKGYRVLEADRGSIALAMVKQHVPDAIVLDAMLPELHGFDICRRIKASARYGHIPILMISAVYRGWRFAEDLKAAYGVNAYVEKPFRIADIVAAIENMLAGATRTDKRDPDALTAEAEAALVAGMEHYKRGDIDKAIEQLDGAVRLDPLSSRLHYHLALLVGRKGDVFRAIQELELAVDLNPKSFSSLENLAVLYQKAGFKHKAIEMWERAIGQSPDDDTRGQIKEHLMSLL